MASVLLPAVVHLTADGIGPIVQGSDFYRPFRLRVATVPVGPFQASTAYAAGDVVSPSVANGFGYLVVPGGGGTAGTPEPTWPTVMGGRVTSSGVQFMAIGTTRLLDTTGFTVQAMVRNDFDSTKLLTMATWNNMVEVGFDPPKWAVGTVYATGQQVVARTPNGWVYQCETAGTSHATTEPTWGTTLGQVNAATDNGVVWRNVASDADRLSNLRISLVPADTLGLDPFANALWDLELNDGVTNSRIMNGFATLSRDVTR